MSVTDMENLKAFYKSLKTIKNFPKEALEVQVFLGKKEKKKKLR